MQSLYLKREFVSLQALRARYEGRPREEAFHLVKARHWSLGHNVILRSLASDAIINGKKINLNAVKQKQRNKETKQKLSPIPFREFECDESFPGRRFKPWYCVSKKPLELDLKVIDWMFLSK